MAKNVLITGVSSGIGHGLAQEYLHRGANVYGLSRRTPSDLVDHPALEFRNQDLSNLDDIPGCLNDFLQGLECLDLVVLNAGMLGKLADMRDTDLLELCELMDLNLWANKVILDAIFDQVQQIRQVVAISSGASVNGNRGWGGYAISKAALNMLTRLYAAENPGVHFAALAPGLVDTAMQDYLCGYPPDDRFPSLENLKSRRGTPEMPGPRQAGSTLAKVIDRLPQLITSGDFADARMLD